MKRREFLGVLSGAAAAWPLDVRGQQTPPLVGFLNGASPDTYRFNADSFREGLAKAGFVEGKNVRIEERVGAWGLSSPSSARGRTGGKERGSNRGDRPRLHPAPVVDFG